MNKIDTLNKIEDAVKKCSDVWQNNFYKLYYCMAAILLILIVFGFLHYAGMLISAFLLLGVLTANHDNVKYYRTYKLFFIILLLINFLI